MNALRRTTFTLMLLAPPACAPGNSEDDTSAPTTSGKSDGWTEGDSDASNTAGTSDSNATSAGTTTTTGGGTTTTGGSGVDTQPGTGTTSAGTGDDETGDTLAHSREVCDCYVHLTQETCIGGGGCTWTPSTAQCSPSLCGIADPPQCDAAKICTWNDGHCYGPDGMLECVTVCGCYAQTTQSSCNAHGDCVWDPQTADCSFATCGGLDEQQCADAKLCTFTDGRCYPPDGC